MISRQKKAVFGQKPAIADIFPFFRKSLKRVRFLLHKFKFLSFFLT